MFYIQKTIEISAAHQLNQSYETPCNNLHGHNWIVTVYCKSKELTEGMVQDFKHIKDIVMKFDHSNINDMLIPPTAENMAYYLQNKIPNCYRVKIQESEDNIAIYEKDEKSSEPSEDKN